MNTFVRYALGFTCIALGIASIFSMREARRQNEIKLAEANVTLVKDGDNISPKDGFEVYEFGGEGFLNIHDVNGDSIAVEVRYFVEATKNWPRIAIYNGKGEMIECKYLKLNEPLMLNDSIAGPFGSVTLESPAINVVWVKIRTIRTPQFSPP